MFLGIVFNCSMENVVCVCAASLVGEEISKETKWACDRAEIAAWCCWTYEGGMFAVCSESYVCRWRK